jgi:3-oxoisoapionate-4-phosphate decarboxylase
MRNPSPSTIRLTYRIETADDPEKLAAKIASDQSTGTFVAVPGETEELKARVAARVVALRPLQPLQQSSFPSSGKGPSTAPTPISNFRSTPSGPISPP